MYNPSLFSYDLNCLPLSQLPFYSPFLALPRSASTPAPLFVTLVATSCPCQWNLQCPRNLLSRYAHSIVSLILSLIWKSDPSLSRRAILVHLPTKSGMQILDKRPSLRSSPGRCPQPVTALAIWLPSSESFFLPADPLLKICPRPNT